MSCPPTPPPTSSCVRHLRHALACLVLLTLIAPALITHHHRTPLSHTSPHHHHHQGPYEHHQLLSQAELSPSAATAGWWGWLPSAVPVWGVSYPDNPLFWSWSGNLSVTTQGGGTLTIVGDYFLAPGQCSIQPTIYFTFSDGSQSLCTLTYQDQSGQLLTCSIPPGTGAPHVTINICGQLNRDLPRMPTDMVYYVGTTPPMSLGWCHVWNNTLAKGFSVASAAQTNWMCSSDSRQKLSSYGHNTNDRSLFTFCSPSLSNNNPNNCLNMQTAKRCINISDPLYPNAWLYTANGITYTYLFCTELASPYYFTWNPNCTTSQCQSQCMQVINPYSNSSTFTSGNAYLCTFTYPSPFPATDTELQYHYAPPLIYTASFPAGNPTAGGAQVTLTGSSFGFQNKSSIVVLPSTSSCVISALNHTYAICTMPPGQGTAYLLMTVDGTASLAPFQVSYDPPFVTSLAPQNPDCAGGSNLTIAGLNFGSVGTVTLQITIGTTFTTRVCSPQFLYNNTAIICAVPAGQGTGQPVYITSGVNVNVAPALLSYLPPQLSVVSPTSYDSSGGAILQLNGTSFGTAGAVTVGGVVCQLTGIGYSNTAVQCILPAGQGALQPVLITASGQVNSPALAFSYLPPSISTASPQGGTGSGVQLTLGGSSFGNGSNSAVYVAGQPCAVAVGQWLQKRLTCTIPQSSGLYLPVWMNVSGQVSNVVSFSFSPQLLNVSAPGGTAPTAGGVLINITGSGFAVPSIANFTVYFGASRCSVTGQSSGWLTCTLPAGGGSVAVIVSVNLTTATLNSTAFTFSYDPPTLLSISPTIGPTAGGTLLSVAGNNFGTSPSVTVNGYACALSGAHNNTFLTCTAPPGSGSGQALIVSSGGGLYTTALPFAYFPPSISSISPVTGRSAGGYNLTISGGNFSTFTSLTLVVVNGQTAPILQQNDTSLTISMPPYTNTIIVNPAVLVNGQTSSQSLAFTYQGASISSVQPVTGPTAGGVLVRINGTNFGSASASGYVLFGSTQAALSGAGYSDTYIECLLPAGMGSAPVTVTVGNAPSLPWPWSYHCTQHHLAPVTRLLCHLR